MQTRFFLQQRVTSSVRSSIERRFSSGFVRQYEKYKAYRLQMEDTTKALPPVQHYLWGKSGNSKLRDQPAGKTSKLVWDIPGEKDPVVFLSLADAAQKLGRATKTLDSYAKKNLYGFRYLNTEKESDRLLLESRIQEFLESAPQYMTKTARAKALNRPVKSTMKKRVIREVNGKIEVFNSLKHAGDTYNRAGKSIKNYCENRLAGFRFLDPEDPDDILLWEKAEWQSKNPENYQNFEDEEHLEAEEKKLFEAQSTEEEEGEENASPNVSFPKRYGGVQRGRANRGNRNPYKSEGMQGEMQRKHQRMMVRCDHLKEWAENNEGRSFRDLRRSEDNEERNLYWFYYRTILNPRQRVLELPQEIMTAFQEILALPHAENFRDTEGERLHGDYSRGGELQSDEMKEEAHEN